MSFLTYTRQNHVCGIVISYIYYISILAEKSTISKIINLYYNITCPILTRNLMNTAGANKLCIKRTMGHASRDITDDVYTHKTLEELIRNIDLI